MSEVRTSLDFTYFDVAQFFELLPEAVKIDARMALDAYKQAWENERRNSVAAVSDWNRRARAITEASRAAKEPAKPPGPPEPPRTPAARFG